MIGLKRKGNKEIVVKTVSKKRKKGHGDSNEEQLGDKIEG